MYDLLSGVQKSISSRKDGQLEAAVWCGDAQVGSVACFPTFPVLLRFNVAYWMEDNLMAAFPLAALKNSIILKMLT